jgi:hypothetical protein
VALTPDSLLLDLRPFRASALGDQADARDDGELLSVPAWCGVLPWRWWCIGVI